MILGNLLPNWMFQPMILLTSKVCVDNWTTYRFWSRLEKKKNIFNLCKMLPEPWMNIKGLWPLWPQKECKVRHKILDCLPPSPLCDSVFVLQPSSSQKCGDVVDVINEQSCESRTEKKCSKVRHPVCHVMKVSQLLFWKIYLLFIILLIQCSSYTLLVWVIRVQTYGQLNDRVNS